jgi:hypothetical protein
MSLRAKRKVMDDVCSSSSTRRQRIVDRITPPPAPPPPTGDTRQRIRERILSQCKLRADKSNSGTICPSEVARFISSSEAVWRPLMPVVRAVAAELIREGVAVPAGGRLVCTQRGAVIPDIAAAKGPIRLKWIHG